MLSTVNVAAEGPDAPKLDATLVTTLSALPNAEAVIPVNELRGQLKVSGVTLDTALVVAAPKYFGLEGIKTSDGRINADTGPEVVITSGVAKAFGKEPDQLIGQGVSLALFIPRVSGSGEETISPQNTFTIVGIAESDENLFLPFTRILQWYIAPARDENKSEGIRHCCPSRIAQSGPGDRPDRFVHLRND